MFSDYRPEKMKTALLKSACLVHYRVANMVVGLF